MPQSATRPAARPQISAFVFYPIMLCSLLSLRYNKSISDCQTFTYICPKGTPANWSFTNSLLFCHTLSQIYYQHARASILASVEVQLISAGAAQCVRVRFGQLRLSKVALGHIRIHSWRLLWLTVPLSCVPHWTLIFVCPQVGPHLNNTICECDVCGGRLAIDRTDRVEDTGVPTTMAIRHRLGGTALCA